MEYNGIPRDNQRISACQLIAVFDKDTRGQKNPGPHGRKGKTTAKKSRPPREEGTGTSSCYAGTVALLDKTRHIHHTNFICHHNSVSRETTIIVRVLGGLQREEKKCPAVTGGNNRAQLTAVFIHSLEES
jgi:hypothetical protein